MSIVLYIYIYIKIYVYNVRYMNEHFSMLYSNMRKRHATPSGALPTRPSKATGLASLMLCGVADAYATLIVAHRGPEFFTDIGRNSDIWSNYSYIYIYIWLVVSTCFNLSEKYESQLGLLVPIYGKIKNVPNHQPYIYVYIYIYMYIYVYIYIYKYIYIYIYIYVYIYIHFLISWVLLY